MVMAAAAVAVVALGAPPARAYPVGPAVPLEELAKTAELVCKATVAAERVVADAWFEKLPGFEVREAELRVISCVKGAPGGPGAQRIRFRHYAPASAPGGMIGGYAPQSYQLAAGRSYLVFAAKGAGGTYRQLAKSHTIKADQGVLLAADARPHRGKTVTEVAWAELLAQLASASIDDAVQAIAQLDELSGGRGTGLHDLERRAALDAIRPLVASKQAALAAAAIAVFGDDSPYFDERQAPFWLAGIGKGSIPGIGPRTPSATPAAAAAATELVAVADGPAPAELRAQAIRALGPLAPAARVAAWGRDPELAVRCAAVLVSAAQPERKLIAAGATATAPELRRAAALAIGFAQDAALVPALDALLKDAAPKVRSAAALSLLSLPLAQADRVMRQNLYSDFMALFVNALARRDPQPYLPQLAEVIERRRAPADWWGGTIPAGESWSILFAYVKGRPAAELAAGKLDRSLDALERMEWFSSSEPRDLYALYLRRGLTARAQRFRAAVKKTASFDMDYYFDMADKSPATYVP